MIRDHSPIAPGSPFVRRNPNVAPPQVGSQETSSADPLDQVSFLRAQRDSKPSRVKSLLWRSAAMPNLQGVSGPAAVPVHESLRACAAGEHYEPVLNPVTLTREQQDRPVSLEVLEKAQKQLDEGDRGGAYLTLYKELGNEQLLIQTQITTYTGIWGSGALTGNSLAKSQAGERYNLQLDEFSREIAQATIDVIRKDLEEGGTGRLGDNDFQTADRKVWVDKNMGELFPGNIQFVDFWNHGPGDRASAIFSRSTLKMLEMGIRALTPNTEWLGLNQDGRNVANLVGKRPAEFAGDPNYKIFGSEADRFITVVDRRTGFVEAFWDNRPKMGLMPMPQIPNHPMDPESTEFAQRKHFYDYLGANRHRASE